MSFGSGFVDLVRRLGAQLVARAEARDGVHLGPERLSRAAAHRLEAGLRILEAYLRRVLVFLALQMEPDLVAVSQPRPRYVQPPRLSLPGPRFRVFVGERALPDFAAIAAVCAPRPRLGPVPRAPPRIRVL